MLLLLWLVLVLNLVFDGCESACTTSVVIATIPVTMPVGLSKNRRDDGTTTGQDEASLPQLAAISCRRRVDGTA